MSARVRIRPLNKAARRKALAKFLSLLDTDPALARFREHVPGGTERQLALYAALERAIFRGDASLCPPASGDLADQLLCDVLQAIDRDPQLGNFCAAHGPHRHRAILESFGGWKGKPLSGPFFTTAISLRSRDAASGLPASETIKSPAPQVSGPNGELIGEENEPRADRTAAAHRAQVVAPACSLAEASSLLAGEEGAEGRGLIRHAAAHPGEELLPATIDPQNVPPRAVRRGRPPALDDMAKGRLLGMMAYGLSLRQAAAQLGVHHVTILNLLKRDEEFAQQVAEARLDAISQPLLTVVQASRTNWRAAAWLAKFLHERRIANIESTPEERELAKQRG